MPDTPKLQSYLLTEKLGESLQSQVYKGYHKSQPDQPLVLKLLKLLSGWDEQARHLHQKIERLRVLHDPRACTPMALDSEANLHFIVQPWFAGHTLAMWTVQHPAINLTDFFTIAGALADTLQTVHEAGITHGGIKPHNILIQPGTLTLRLTDFITPLTSAMSVISSTTLSSCAAHWPIPRPSKPGALIIGWIFPPTCIRWASCSTSCSPARCRFFPPTRWS